MRQPTGSPTTSRLHGRSARRANGCILRAAASKISTVRARPALRVSPTTRTIPYAPEYLHARSQQRLLTCARPLGHAQESRLLEACRTLVGQTVRWRRSAAAARRRYLGMAASFLVPAENSLSARCAPPSTLTLRRGPDCAGKPILRDVWTHVAVPGKRLRRSHTWVNHGRIRPSPRTITDRSGHVDQSYRSIFPFEI